MQPKRAVSTKTPSRDSFPMINHHCNVHLVGNYRRWPTHVVLCSVDTNVNWKCSQPSFVRFLRQRMRKGSKCGRSWSAFSSCCGSKDRSTSNACGWRPGKFVLGWWTYHRCMLLDLFAGGTSSGASKACLKNARCVRSASNLAASSRGVLCPAVGFFLYGAVRHGDEQPRPRPQCF